MIDALPAPHRLAPAANGFNPVPTTDGLSLIFDTETTGLWNKRLPTTHRDQPHLVQLAARLVDIRSPVAFVYCIVKPEGYEIPPKATAAHGITQEHAEKVGIPLESALTIFASLVSRCDQIIAHNLDFDVMVMVRELTPMGLGALFADKLRYCTMLESTPICRLPHKDSTWTGFKWPKLEEAYRFAFGEEMDGAHDAWADVNATVRLWRWLKAGAPKYQQTENQPTP